MEGKKASPKADAERCSAKCCRLGQREPDEPYSANAVGSPFPLSKCVDAICSFLLDESFHGEL